MLKKIVFFVLVYCFFSNKSICSDKEKKLLRSIEKEKISSVQKKLQQLKKKELKAFFETYLPLNIAAKKGNLVLAKELFYSYPESIHLKDKDERTPLHHAMMSHFSSKELLFFFIFCHDKILPKKDVKQKMALHYGLSNPYIKTSLINDLILFDPEVLQIADKKGRTALHYAVKFRSSDLALIKNMINNQPHNIQAADKTGHISLHYALGYQAQSSFNEKSVDLIELLIKAYPNSIYIKDEKDQSPLFYLQNHPFGKTPITKEVLSVIQLMHPELFLSSNVYAKSVHQNCLTQPFVKLLGKISGTFSDMKKSDT
jgi:ankyrin repeat protein